MNIEKPQIDQFTQKGIDLIEGKIKPNNRVEKQIILAYQMYKDINPQENINLENNEDRDKFMLFWSPLEREEDCFSVIFSKIENDPAFIEHPRLRGDINNITIEDVKYYKENNELNLTPEEKRQLEKAT